MSRIDNRILSTIQFTFSFLSISIADSFWSKGSRTERMMFSSVMLKSERVHIV